MTLSAQERKLLVKCGLHPNNWEKIIEGKETILIISKDHTKLKNIRKERIKSE